MKILGNNSSKITPNYFSKLCGTTGLIVFFIKDVLDFIGITWDKKNFSSKPINYVNLILEELNHKLEKLKFISNNLLQI